MRADFRDIKVANYNPETENHIKPTGELVFIKRTKNTEGYSTVIPPEKLIHIRNYIQKRIDNNETYLFTAGNTGNPHTTYPAFIKTCFVRNKLKPYTINDFRHMEEQRFIGDHLPKREERDEQERKMGHAMSTVFNNYVF